MSKKRVRVPTPEGDRMFVRVPIPPELVALVRERVDHLGELVTLGRQVLDLAKKLAEDVEKDALRVNAALRRNRRPRRR